MSPVAETFIRAVLAKDWQNAFLNLNGLNMWEMLLDSGSTGGAGGSTRSVLAAC
jgi:hypothetical protein